MRIEPVQTQALSDHIIKCLVEKISAKYLR